MPVSRFPFEQHFACGEIYVVFDSEDIATRCPKCGSIPIELPKPVKEHQHICDWILSLQHAYECSDECIGKTPEMCHNYPCKDSRNDDTQE